MNGALGENFSIESYEEVPVAVLKSLAKNAEEGTRVTYACGIQRVAKFRDLEKFGEEARNTIVLHCLCIQVPTRGADILISFNAPTKLSTIGSSAKFEAVQEGAEGNAPGSEVFFSCASTFAIRDYGLFG